MVATALSKLQTYAKLLQMKLPWGLEPPWLHPNNNLSTFAAFFYHNECLGAVYLIKCSGHGGHRSPKAANLSKTSEHAAAMGSGATLLAS